MSSAHVYVYEDPCIGAIIDAIARIDHAFSEKGYRSILKQTTGRAIRSVGDLVMGMFNGSFVVVEFKSPIGISHIHSNGIGIWRYRMRNVNTLSTSVKNALSNLAKEGGYFLGLIHLYADARSAISIANAGLSHATYLYAPLTTVFVRINHEVFNALNQSPNIHYLEIHAQCTYIGKPRPWNLDMPLRRRSIVVERYDYTIPGLRQCTFGDRPLRIVVHPSGTEIYAEGYSLPLLLKCLEQGRIGISISKIIDRNKKLLKLQRKLSTLASLSVKSTEWRNFLVIFGSLTTMDLHTASELLGKIIEKLGQT